MQAYYVSWHSQKEYLEMCVKKVLNMILEEVRHAHYCGITIDGMTDVSQLVFIMRYVHEKDKKWDVQE